MGRPDLRELIAGQYEGLSGEEIIVTSACPDLLPIESKQSTLKTGILIVVSRE